MLTVRAARLSDLEDLVKLSAETGAGMTTMPADINNWQAKLELTEASFRQQLEDPRDSVMVLVLEDINTGRVIGTSALIASVGSKMPFYSYKLSTQVMVSTTLNINTNTQILHLVNDFTNCTELASLFLSQSYRSNPLYKGAGRFLSLARFLVIQDFPHLFSDRIFAELRGFVDDKGESPFWNALGKKFFGLEYSRADLLSGVSGNQFISDLMPKYPIYLDLLPDSAREVVGKANTASLPAKRLLEKEGFVDTGYVDIFDAGPTLEARKSQLKTLSAAKTGNISAGQLTADSSHKRLFMLSNANPDDYRILLAEGQIDTEHKDAITIDPSSYEALKLRDEYQPSWTEFGEIRT